METTDTLQSILGVLLYCVLSSLLVQQISQHTYLYILCANHYEAKVMAPTEYDLVHQLFVSHLFICNDIIKYHNYIRYFGFTVVVFVLAHGNLLVLVLLLLQYLTYYLYIETCIYNQLYLII